MSDASPTGPSPLLDDPTRDYGAKIAAVEPGGVEFIPLNERHGRPAQLVWTWTSPNMEFATIAVGILGPLYFGLTFWQSVLAILLGTGLGALSHGYLSSWGPKGGLPQMVLSRTGFGFLGNILPAGLNALVAGIGWFAVNSVSGALALHVLVPGLPALLCLVIVVLAEFLLAFFGHNLVQAFERWVFPVLAVVFVLGSIIVLSKADLGRPADNPGGIGGFLIMFGATFGYAAGWNPYATDYTRYLSPETSARRTGISAAIGLFWSCVVLETAGAAVVAAGQNALDPSSYTGLLPGWLADLTLVAIVLGAISANALNVYSGSLSFVAAGVPLHNHLARATVAVGFGVIGFLVAWAALGDSSSYEAFLLIIAYWVAPWLGVVLTDRWMRRGVVPSRSLAATRSNVNIAGPIAMLVGMVLSIWLFSNQEKYVGLVPAHIPAVGDLTFVVGFVVAAALYYAIFTATGGPSAGSRARADEVAAMAD